jgi:hypothetical protein
MFYLLTAIILHICRFDISQWFGNQRHHRVLHICFFLDILLKLDTNGKLMTQFDDKRYDFYFSIVNIHFLCSNIQISPAYGVYISKLIRYTKSSSTYDQFLIQGNLLTKKVDVTVVSTVSFASSFLSRFMVATTM